MNRMGEEPIALGSKHEFGTIYEEWALFHSWRCSATIVVQQNGYWYVLCLESILSPSQR